MMPAHVGRQEDESGVKNCFGKKVIVVVDAGDRLGAAVARHLSYGGASVVLGCLETASRSVRELAHELCWDGAMAIAVPAATRGMRQIIELIDAAIEHFGKFDVIVNNQVCLPSPNPDSVEGESLHRRDLHAWLYGAAAAMLYAESHSPGQLVNVIVSPRAQPARNGYIEDADAASRRLYDRLAQELGNYRIRTTLIYLSGCDPGHWSRRCNHDCNAEACLNSSRAVESVVRAIELAVNQQADTRIDEIRMSLS